MENIIKLGGWIILSKDVDSGIDVCLHDWTQGPVRKIHGYHVYLCQRSGCLGIYSPHRSAIEEFIECYRELPKIPMKLPEGGYHSDEELARMLTKKTEKYWDPRQIKKYYEVLQGFDIDGAPAHIIADGRPFMYRDDTGPSINKERELPPPLSEPPPPPRRHEPSRPLINWLAERPTLILRKPIIRRIRETIP